MKPDDFDSIYRGLAGECACGCSGVHIPDTDRRRYLRAFKRLKALSEAGNPGYDDPNNIMVLDDRGIYMYVGYYKGR
jgi:hypothetical protein